MLAGGEELRRIALVHARDAKSYRPPLYILMLIIGSLTRRLGVGLDWAENESLLENVEFVVGAKCRRIVCYASILA